MHVGSLSKTVPPTVDLWQWIQSDIAYRELPLLLRVHKILSMRKKKDAYKSNLGTGGIRR